MVPAGRYVYADRLSEALADAAAEYRVAAATRTIAAECRAAAE
jgi:hypothetical protein